MGNKLKWEGIVAQKKEQEEKKEQKETIANLKTAAVEARQRVDAEKETRLQKGPRKSIDDSQPLKTNKDVEAAQMTEIMGNYSNKIPRQPEQEEKKRTKRNNSKFKNSSSRSKTTCRRRN